MTYNNTDIEDKNICLNHMGDKAIIEFLQENGEDGICNYCQLGFQEGKTISLKKLVKFIDTRIRVLYGEADDEGVGYDSTDGGYQGVSVFDTYDLIHDEISIDVNSDELIQDIINSLVNTFWCKKDPYWESKDKRLIYSWKEFSNVVKHKNRYSFFQTDSNSEILKDIANGVDSLNLINKIKINDVIFRCRQHSKDQLVNDFANLSSPPVKYCYFSNRMSAAGISMFYRAFDIDTSKKEVIDFDKLPNLSELTMGNFKVTKELNVVDFSNLPEVPSIFSKVEENEYYLILFFHRFISDLSKSIERNNKIHIEYVPTQVLTEFFRFIYPTSLNTTINGIIYNSSKNIKGKCCVLFMDNEESKEYLELISTTKNEITSC